PLTPSYQIADRIQKALKSLRYELTQRAKYTNISLSLSLLCPSPRFSLSLSLSLSLLLSFSFSSSSLFSPSVPLFCPPSLSLSLSLCLLLRSLSSRRMKWSPELVFVHYKDSELAKEDE